MAWLMYIRRGSNHHDFTSFIFVRVLSFSQEQQQQRYTHSGLLLWVNSEDRDDAQQQPQQQQKKDFQQPIFQHYLIETFLPC